MTRQILAICLCLAIGVALACCSSATTATPSKPRALIPISTPIRDRGLHLLVEVSGKIAHKRPGWNEYLPLSFGTVLDQEDLLMVGLDAEALIVCSDLSLTHVASGYHGGLTCPKSKPVLVRDEDPVVIPRRGTSSISSIPYVLSPRHSYVQTSQPLLSWNTSCIGKPAYVVQVQGRTLSWRAEITTSKMVYPRDAPPLESGIAYSVVVTDCDGNSSTEEITNLDLRFSLLSTEEAQAVATRIEIARRLGLDSNAIRLLESEIYASHKLLADAVLVLEPLRYQGIPAISQRLGDLYLEMELFGEAISAYRQAVVGYRALGDEYEEAYTLVGLALAYRGNRSDSDARDSLEEARTLYATIGDIEGITRVDRLLVEIGGSP